MYRVATVAAVCSLVALFLLGGCGSAEEPGNGEQDTTEGANGPVMEEQNTEQEVPDYYHRLVDYCDDHEPLRERGFELFVDDDERNTIAFERLRDGESTVIVINCSNEAHSIRIPVDYSGTYEMVFATRDDSHRVQQDGTALLLELAERYGMVLVGGPDR